MTAVDFELITFGGLELRDAAGTPVPLPSRKARALLAILACQPDQAMPRAQVAALLWGDRGEEQARGSLRQTLSQLRKEVGDPGGQLLISSRDDLRIDVARLTADVAAFDRHIASATYKDLKRACELYRGPFLDGFDLRDESFEEWRARERSRLEVAMVHALSELATHCEAEGELEAARSHITRLLTIAPLREEMQRAAMRLCLAVGQPTEAIRQYENFRSLLETELGVAPQPETHRLYEQLLAQRGGADSPSSEKHNEQSKSERAANSPAAYRAVEGSVGVGAGARAGKPSIAILPFHNLSGDPEQEFFADGMTEDIITELSRFRGLFVIARNSTFVYKGHPVDTRQIGEELGVKYVLEGSVRSSADRIRISAQLIDAAERSHVWAERYDRKLTDLFTLQDEITQTIVSALEPELDDAERRSAVSADRDRLDAWGAYHRGMWHIYRFTKEDTRQALEFFEQAIGFQPTLASSWSGKSFAHFSNAFLGFSDDRDAERQLALNAARHSVELDPRDATAHWALARAFTLEANYDRAIPELETAVALNTNLAQAWYQLGWVLVRAGRPEEAVAPVLLAERLSPNDPLRFAFSIVRAQAQFVLGEFGEALSLAEQASRLPHAHSHVEAIRIACLVKNDRDDEARDAMGKFRRYHPSYTRSFFREAHGFKRTQDNTLYDDALNQAGMPE